MKLRISIILLSSLLTLAIGRHPEPIPTYYATYGVWETAAYAQPPALNAKDTFLALQIAWQDASDTLRAETAYGYSRAAIRTARLVANSGDYHNAASFLAEAGIVAGTYPVVPGRGKSAAIFQELASLHAEVVVATNADPLRGLFIGYELGSHGDGFYALQESLRIDRTVSLASRVELPDLAPNEAAGTLLRLDSSGRLLDLTPVALRISEDTSVPLRERLTAIYEWGEARSGSRDGCVRRVMEAHSKTASQRFGPLALLEGRRTAGDRPGASMTPARRLQDDPSKPNDSLSIWPWLVVVVAPGIAAWVAFKRRPFSRKH